MDALWKKKASLFTVSLAGGTHAAVIFHVRQASLKSLVLYA